MFYVINVIEDKQMDLYLETKSSHASFVSSDQISTTFFTLFGDALVSGFSGFRTSTARFQLLSVRPYWKIVRLLLLIRHFSSTI